MKRIVILLVSIALTGCAVVRPTDPYRAADVPYRSAHIKVVEDPAAVVPDGTMTLQQAIEFALSNNPEIAATEMDVSAAQARHDQVFSGRLPRSSVLRKSEANFIAG